MNINFPLLHLIAKILLIVGGLNWGLVGLLNLDLVALIFGHMSLLSRLIYFIVGVAGGYELYLFIQKRKPAKTTA